MKDGAHRLPKLCGADVELGNFVRGLRPHGATGYEASRALLREIDGLPRALPRSNGYGGGLGYFVGRTYEPQDWGRKFLSTNGGCVYIDLDHLELCIPEVISAYDHVAAWHAMLRIARRAQVAANEKLPAGQHIHVLVNNSDGQSNSYGSHLNFLITRRAWENIFTRKLHYLMFLASCQVSSIVVTGQGKVGAENGAPEVAFQLAQRADFFETLVGPQTTYHRPLVNSRDESLCGVDQQMARLHCIFFDNTLCHVASLLKVGIMQIVLAMIEAERVNPRLLLDDPVDAVRCWSHDLTLHARAPMASGRELTALELQLLFLEEARRFADAGGCDGIVPRADDILLLWEDTLGKLQSGDLSALVPRLDWVLKLHCLQRAMQQHPGLSWGSPAIRHLDQIYGSLDPAEGLYWAYENSGAVERVVSETQIDRFTREPPEDTRAWTRAMLLRRAGAGAVEAVGWDSITFRRSGPWGRHRLELGNPLVFTRGETMGAFANGAALDGILEALGASPPNGAKGDTHEAS